MFILYSDKKSEGDFSWGSVSRLNPNSCWATHYYNRVVLAHISRATKDFNEKQQAEKEIEIADRKMKFWERMDGFILDSAKAIVKERYKI